eukprot:TRINITY_DN13027_c2_g1_i4.p4 TRINITY_DN13027_c2_g1~~TRINITY_DN13027_c2_g1_i4.p4  ORF type:complete len:114 (+),score=5.52 TRINITY_DN13027_c2_g1_i4:374-715(+)
MFLYKKKQILFKIYKHPKTMYKIVTQKNQISKISSQKQKAQKTKYCVCTNIFGIVDCNEMCKQTNKRTNNISSSKNAREQKQKKETDFDGHRALLQLNHASQLPLHTTQINQM